MKIVKDEPPHPPPFPLKTITTVNLIRHSNWKNCFCRFLESKCCSTYELNLCEINDLNIYFCVIDKITCVKIFFGIKFMCLIWFTLFTVLRTRYIISVLDPDPHWSWIWGWNMIRFKHKGNSKLGPEPE